MMGMMGMMKPNRRIKMARRDWSSMQSVHTYVLSELKKYDSVPESDLNTRHDPNIVTQVLNLLVERGVINLKIDENKVGSSRRVYSLAYGGTHD